MAYSQVCRSGSRREVALWSVHKHTTEALDTTFVKNAMEPDAQHLVYALAHTVQQANSQGIKHYSLLTEGRVHCGTKVHQSSCREGSEGPGHL